ncbi:hypothetical protein [Streptomyces sp. NPDC051561]|uniref:hypothetical protein n=1 Tax=Streptomyces sp. NPDC051561 TaxID=3365658 RepID=UPI0037BD5633
MTPVNDEAPAATAAIRPDDRAASALRFTTELIAWVATPWALIGAGFSWVLAVASVLVLIGLPTFLSTPGDKNQVIVAVPGWATILLVLLQLVAAVLASWLAWPVWAAVAVSALAAVTVFTERKRWGWLRVRDASGR